MSIFIETSTPWPGAPSVPYGPRGISPILTLEEEEELLAELARGVVVPEAALPDDAGDPTVRRRTNPAPLALVFPARERRVFHEICLNPRVENPTSSVERELIELAHNTRIIPSSSSAENPTSFFERELIELAHNTRVIPSSSSAYDLEEGEMPDDDDDDEAREDPSSTVNDPKKSVFDRLGPKLIPSPETDPEVRSKKKKAQSVRYRSTYVTPEDLTEALNSVESKKRKAAEKKKKRDTAKMQKKDEEARIKEVVGKMKLSLEKKKEEEEQKEKKEEEEQREKKEENE
ncbi:X-linked retinitis pigmentosa GTPase regulator-interacting protein 1-like [Thrips palmi]|uniref:X-linked retinitis pigmentosa GTPase regulator-interacting protein 1-like n=1 Tax=Thrips palmi TaxID=161013 RepID=A0A6P8ZTA2_THRPL|nr:X-linked retinitis pigmentosa GTPase regulator-interacting protein 1-like [Thrips palmi]